MKQYPRIALTGGIASGKSTVAKMFEGKGAFIIDADFIAKKIVEPGTIAWKRLYSILGGEYFDPRGHLKRRAVREKISLDPTFKRKLEEITHPEIIREMEILWQTRTANNPNQIVIFDIPLLFEARLEDHFDFIIVVYVPLPLQIERLASRDKIPLEEAQKLAILQEDIESKKDRATAVIFNYSLEETRLQVDRIWDHLTQIWSNR